MKKRQPKTFKIPKGYKGIRADIELKLNSNIAVITGLNGSGKTTLLKHIFENSKDRSKVFFKTQKSDTQSRDNFLRRRSRDDSHAPSFDDIYEEVLRVFRDSNREPYTHSHELFSMLFDKDSTLYEGGYDFLLKLSERTLAPLDYSDNIKKKLGVPTENDVGLAMIKRLNVEIKSNQKLSSLPKIGKRVYESYKERLLGPEHLQVIRSMEVEEAQQLKVCLRAKSSIKNRHDFEAYIYELVSNNSFSIESIVQQLARRIYEDAKAKSSRTKTKKLWEDINTELEKYSKKEQFNYEIIPPSIYSSNYEMTFSSTVDSKEVHFESLSSGEKIIFELICYYFLAGKNKKLETIILDEFDANLNPALAETYLAVVKEQFADKGITAILTTHSPSTVAEVDAENLYEVSITNGLQSIDCAVNPKGKKDILKKLAPNFVYYSEFGLLEHVLRGEKDVIIFTEGKNDVRNFTSIANDYTFVECGGEGNIKNMLQCLKCIPFLKDSIKNKIVIALFDFDRAGREAIQSILAGEANDTFAHKITNKERLYIKHNDNIFLAMMMPNEKSDFAWEKKNSRYRHQELKREGQEGVKRQKTLIEAIKSEEDINF